MAALHQVLLSPSTYICLTYPPFRILLIDKLNEINNNQLTERFGDAYHLQKPSAQAEETKEQNGTNHFNCKWFQFFHVDGNYPCCWPANDHRRYAYCCATAVQFCPPGFALPSFVSLPLACPLPPASWFMVGPASRYVQHDMCQGEVTMRGMIGCHGYPLGLHFAYTCFLIASFPVN